MPTRGVRASTATRGVRAGTYLHMVLEQVLSYTSTFNSTNDFDKLQVPQLKTFFFNIAEEEPARILQLVILFEIWHRVWVGHLGFKNQQLQDVITP